MSIVLAAQERHTACRNSKKRPRPNRISHAGRPLSHGQIGPEVKASLLLKAQHATGVPDAEAATILVVQAAAMAAQQTGNAEELLEAAIHTLGQIKPEGALQSMLAVQMIGVHNSAVRFLVRASDDAQTLEGADANVQRAVRLFRLFNEQLQALASLRGKTGQQKVTVEHVHVYEGGQAIVGSVSKIGHLTPGGGE